MSSCNDFCHEISFWSTYTDYTCLDRSQDACCNCQFLVHYRAGQGLNYKGRLPFLLRWSRSHCCSPCLPPPCSLLCKTRSLLSRPLTCGLCCYCQVCLEHYRRNYCRLCYHDAVVRLSPLELVHGRDVASSLAWEPAIYDSYVLPCWRFGIEIPRTNNTSRLKWSKITILT